MIQHASLDLFSVLDTPVCSDQSNEFCTALGVLAQWFTAWKTVTSLRQGGTVAATWTVVFGLQSKRLTME